ncbi:MAG TPA: hypothetical protein VEA38_15060 [Terriglobales bacterium]|nr:hypothetical protein [Terriglobales bacterium]
MEEPKDVSDFEVGMQETWPLDGARPGVATVTGIGGEPTVTLGDKPKKKAGRRAMRDELQDTWHVYDPVKPKTMLGAEWSRHERRKRAKLAMLELRRAVAEAEQKKRETERVVHASHVPTQVIVRGPKL